MNNVEEIDECSHSVSDCALFDVLFDDEDPAAADAPGKPAMDYDFLEGDP